MEHVRNDPEVRKALDAYFASTHTDEEEMAWGRYRNLVADRLFALSSRT